MATLDDQVASLTQTVSDLLAAITFQRTYLTNAVNSAANSATSVVANSVTPLTVVVGSKTLTIEIGKQFVPGQFIVIVDKGNNNNWLYGNVTSYDFNSGLLVVNVTDTSGSGTLSNWLVSIASIRGLQGIQGDNILKAFTNKNQTTANLTYGYYGGNVRVNNSTVNVPDGTILLAANTTNYIEVTSAGVVSVNTTGFSIGSLPMATVVTNASIITSITDMRGDNTIASIRSIVSAAGGNKYGDVNLVVADIAGAAPLLSPALTGVPTAPTATQSDSSTTLATTAFVMNQIATVDPLMDGIAAVGTATKFAREDHIHPIDTTRAPLASPGLTGIPTAPTAAIDTDTSQLATTAFVIGQSASASPLMDGVAAVGTATKFAREDHVHPIDSSRAPLASPGLTGIPTAPTAAVDTDTTQLATTAFVVGQSATASPLMDGVATVGIATKFAREDHVHPIDSTRAPLISPALSGTPTAPTPVNGTNTTQLATTAYVQTTVNGKLVKDVTGSVDIVLSATEAATPIITFIGVLGADINVVFPTNTGLWTVTNSTTGAYKLTCKTSTGTGVTVTQNGTTDILGDGSNILDRNSGNANTNLTGTPTAPTATSGTNTNQIATTAYVSTAIANLVSSAPATLDTLNEIATALGDDPNFATTMTNQLALKAPLASPALTGTPTAPTATLNDNSTLIATTAYVLGQGSTINPLMAGTAAPGVSNRWTREDHVHPIDTTRAPLASPGLTGIPTAPTASVDTNTTQLATTAFVLSQAATAAPLMDSVATVGTATKFAREDHVHPSDTTKANLASPTFTGTPAAPSAALGTNSTQLATTEFVQNVISTVVSKDVTGNTDVTLAASEYGSLIIKLIGTLSGNINIVFPNTGVWTIINATTGAFSVTCKTAAGTGIIVNQSLTEVIVADGTNVQTAFSDLTNVALLGNSTAITQTTGDNSTKIATTAFVKNQAYATLASPALTGTPTAPTALTSDNSTTLATTAYVKAQAYATLASPALTGTPTAPTAALNTNTTQIATTAFVLGQAATTLPLMAGTAAIGTGTTWARTDHVHPIDTTRAPLASPAFTGTPTAPTPTTGDVSTNVATTAFTQATADNSAIVYSIVFG